MKKISREYAKTQLAIYKIINSNEEDLKLILNADYIFRSGENEGENIKYNTIYDKAVSKFLIKYFKEIVLKGVSNSYLKKDMEAFFANYDIEIVGKNEKLYRCSCCGYLTLDSTGEYDICRLCGWEDDGTKATEVNRFSQVNGSALNNYRNEFEKKLNSIEIIFDK
ncbi:CPCC family cysteine-rich protein [Chryseobacterium echinoideorum]|uniref:CPCC family cysteine-rich protein n=1 Tax=Chryseobacterium echinoideorum TaxID=1549648 RepID=UPI00162AD0A8|nr:CPCC family cysteine-rich protein [Chryseobacterium echinoideorum]